MAGEKDVHMFDYVVNIEDNVAKYSCNMQTLDHFPCSHVLAACSRGSGGANRAYFDLISMWYTKAMYSAAYAPLFHPVPNSRHWNVYDGPIIQPPPMCRNLGHPRSTRIKGFMDPPSSSGHNRCSKCGSIGHKKKPCPR